MLDLVIRGGRIYDGTGPASREGDRRIRGERVVSVGDRHVASAARIVDVDVLAIAQGFIDVHSHYDRLVLGCAPDRFVFDPPSVANTNRDERPIQQPPVKPCVLVDGSLTVDDGPVGAGRRCKVLRRTVRA